MKYQNSIILAVLLIGLLILTFIFLKDLNLLITTIIGLLFSVPISLFWLEYKMPVLQIKKEIEEVIIELPYQTDPVIKYKLSLAMDGFGNAPPITYKCIRIIIDNIGRNAAKKCKSYFVTPEGKERICWTVPTERPNATINVGDNERLDFCAFPIGIKSYDRIIVPHEDGWGNPWITGPLFNCKLLVTSENAEPVEASIKIDFRQETIEIE
jgi:hypothetical protein